MKLPAPLLAFLGTAAVAVAGPVWGDEDQLSVKTVPVNETLQVLQGRGGNVLASIGEDLGGHDRCSPGNLNHLTRVTDVGGK